jgi:hypothetical protein
MVNASTISTSEARKEALTAGAAVAHMVTSPASLPMQATSAARPPAVFPPARRVPAGAISLSAVQGKPSGGTPSSTRANYRKTRRSPSEGHKNRAAGAVVENRRATGPPIWKKALECLYSSHHSVRDSGHAVMGTCLAHFQSMKNERH